MRQSLSVFLLVLGLLKATSAAAATPAGCSGSRPYLLLVASLLPTDAHLALQRHLDVELSPRGIEICADATSRSALATLEVRPGPGAGATFELVLQDQVTGKTLLRTLDLASIPENGRALALSISADELIRASWAELGLAHAPSMSRKLPIEVRRSESHDRELDRRSRAVWLDAALSSQLFANRTLLFGADLGAGLRVLGPLALEAKIGLRRSGSVAAPDGTIHFTVERAELALGVVLVDSVSLRWLALAGGDVSRVAVEGNALAGALGRSGTAVASSTSVASLLQLPFSARTGFGVLLNAGYMLQEVHALDHATREASLSGAYIALSTQLVIEL